VTYRVPVCACYLHTFSLERKRVYWVRQLPVWRWNCNSVFSAQQRCALCIGKAVPLEVWRGPESSKRLRLPDFKTVDNTKVVSLPALRTGHLYPQKIFLVLISVRDWFNPRPQCGQKEWHLQESNRRPSYLYLNQLRHRVAPVFVDRNKEYRDTVKDLLPLATAVETSVSSELKLVLIIKNVSLKLPFQYRRLKLNPCIRKTFHI
jgi:hypothetical protein